MSKFVFKMSKTYSNSGFKGGVVDILNTVLNNFFSKGRYTNSIFFVLLILPKPIFVFRKYAKNVF